MNEDYQWVCKKCNMFNAGQRVVGEHIRKGDTIKCESCGKKHKVIDITKELDVKCV